MTKGEATDLIYELLADVEIGNLQLLSLGKLIEQYIDQIDSLEED